MATLFEGMWHGDVPALPIVRHEGLGVMAVLANAQETVGHAVLFPRRPVDTYEELTYAEEDGMMLIARALAKHMKRQLGVERVVRHIEGYGVPNHTHAVLVPSYQRGDSDRIHHPGPRLPFDEFAEQSRSTQVRLQLPDEAVQRELLAREEYVRALIEDVT